MKRHWVWSEGKWQGRFRDQGEAELNAQTWAGAGAGLAFVARAGLLRFRFVAGFPKEREPELRELFEQYQGRIGEASSAGP
jgi:hypothetical protein